MSGRVRSLAISTELPRAGKAVLALKRQDKMQAQNPDKSQQIWSLFQVLDVETDPEKLVNYVCGSNYKLEGEDVKIKPDSEYPDWLFTMDVKRPRPKSWEMEDKNTIEYWETVNLEGHKKRNRLMSQGLLKLQDKK